MYITEKRVKFETGAYNLLLGIRTLVSPFLKKCKFEKMKEEIAVNFFSYDVFD
jgi:hypothetical protein